MNVSDVKGNPMDEPIDKSSAFTLPNGAVFESLANPNFVLRGREYLVPGVILSSSLCIMAGSGGSGKSSLCGHLAAAVSQGRPAFGLDPVKDYKTHVPKGNVIWVTKEEGVETELLPRLIAEGAALERIFVLRKGNVDLDDPKVVRALLDSKRPLLVILDPLTSFLGSESSNKKARATLEPILKVCHELQLSTALVGIAHTNKANDGTVKSVLGTVGLPNLSRSTLMVTSKNGSSEIRITKSNFKARTEALTFKIQGMEPEEAERLVSESGVAVSSRQDGVFESFCKVVIKGWSEPTPDNNSINSLEKSQQIVREYLEQEGGDMSFDDLKSELVGEFLTLTQYNIAVNTMKESGQLKLLEEFDSWHVVLVRKSKVL